MAKVSSVSDIKKAIKYKEKVLEPTNKKAEFILLALSKLPAAVFASGATAATIAAGASSALGMAAAALTTAQIWAIIALAGVISIIVVLRAQHCTIKVEIGPDGTRRFVVDFNK